MGTEIFASRPNYCASRSLAENAPNPRISTRSRVAPIFIDRGAPNT